MVSGLCPTVDFNTTAEVSRIHFSYWIYVEAPTMSDLGPRTACCAVLQCERVVLLERVHSFICRLRSLDTTAVHGPQDQLVRS